MQWGDAGNVRLMMESIEECRGLAQDLGINLWFRQGGYLFLARTEAGERRLVRNAELHAEVGAPTRLLTAAEAQAIVPQLDVAEVRLASYNPDDGVVFPWPFVWGYAAQAVRHGVHLRTHTSVASRPARRRLHARAVDRRARRRGPRRQRDRRVERIIKPSPRHRAAEPPPPPRDPELRAAQAVPRSAGRRPVDRPVLLAEHPRRAGHRHHPARREGRQRHLADLHSSLRFLGHLSRTLTRLMPITAAMKVLRQWVGPYDVSPDGDAIVGPSPGHPNADPGVRLHRPRLHDGARGRPPARALPRRWDSPPDARALGPGSIRRRRGQPARGHDHRLTRRHPRRRSRRRLFRSGCVSTAIPGRPGSDRRVVVPRCVRRNLLCEPHFSGIIGVLCSPDFAQVSRSSGPCTHLACVAGDAGPRERPPEHPRRRGDRGGRDAPTRASRSALLWPSTTEALRPVLASRNCSDLSSGIHAARGG
jgi:glycine/D-amino acid oxidase-like deaminating enzyme